jgi:hypothetical protein
MAPDISSDRGGSLDHEAVAGSLIKAGFSATVRGEGAARFVFAEAAGRAVEISDAGEGIWVEYWDCGDERPKFERTFPGGDAAAADACAWLSGASRQ